MAYLKLKKAGKFPSRPIDSVQEDRKEEPVIRDGPVQVCLYRDASLPDKVVAGSHPTLLGASLRGTEMTPSMSELESVVKNRRVAIIGGGFDHLFEEIARIAAKVVFIVRPDDPQPDLDKYTCEVESWFNYWCQLPDQAKHIHQSIYNYSFRHPTSEQRIMYTGIHVTGASKKNARDFCKWLNEAYDPQNFDQLVRNGRKATLAVEYILRARGNHADKRELIINGETIPIIVSSGDEPIRDTLCYLIENFGCNVSIIFHVEVKTNTLRVYCSSKTGTPSASEVAGGWLCDVSGRADGTRYHATATYDLDRIGYNNFIKVFKIRGDQN